MKILVIHATAGAGHKKAAEAIHHGLTAAAGHDARLVDALDYTNPFFKLTYPNTYSLMVTKAPWAWQFFFWVLGIRWLQPAVRIVRRIYNGLNAGKLQKYLIDEQFDCVITTQFLSAEVSAYLKRGGKIKSKVMCVVTDFDVHPIWVNEGIDLYTVASPFTKERIVDLGVPSDKVFVTGIPTDSKFAQHFDRAALNQKFGLKEKGLKILIATGSFGMGPIEELAELLKEHQLLIVCGHNKDLHQRLKAKANADTHVFGLVDNMHELMSAADVMICKPGGLSICEALVKHLPMLFFCAIPGQETQNIMVLKKYGAGQEQCSLHDIARQINHWSAHPQDLERMRQNLIALSKPNAVSDIIGLI